MEPQSYTTDLLDQLLSLAQPRPDLITPGSQAPGVLSMPRPATWAGRVIYADQPRPDPTALLGMMPMGGVPDEEGLVAPIATSSMASFGIGASLKKLAENIKGKFPTSIVTKTGEPALYFHGTPEAFGEFDLSKAKPGLYGKGIYLTNDPSITVGYAENKGWKATLAPRSLLDAEEDVTRFRLGWKKATRQQDAAGEKFFGDLLLIAEEQVKELRSKVGPTPNIRPAFVKIQKPFDVDRMYTKEEARQLINEAGKLRPMTGLTGIRGVPEAYKTVNVLEGDLSREAGKSNVVSGERLFQSIKSLLGDDQTTQALQAAGYDGIKHTGGQISGGKPHQVVVAFSPSQVVSAFDPSLQPQAITGGTPLLPPATIKALTTPGKSEFTVDLPRKLK